MQEKQEIPRVRAFVGEEEVWLTEEEQQIILEYRNANAQKKDLIDRIGFFTCSFGDHATHHLL
jgi:hypothetical protein